MHRSGTSAFAGVLNQVGIPMGKVLMEAAYDNPKGFYENERVVQINEQILSILGQSWDTTEALPQNWLLNPQLETCKLAIESFLRTEFVGIANFALKDPRFSLTFPLWEKVFKILNIRVKQFILVRHPYEVAQSLLKRNQFTREKAINLWSKYNINAELISRGYFRRFIAYEKLLKEPSTILSLLDLNWNGSLPQKKAIANQFINKKLRHHYTAQTIDNSLVKQLYAALLNLAKQEGIDSSEAIFDELIETKAFKAMIAPVAVTTTLAIDFGSGFNKTAPITQIINLDTDKLVFEFSLKQGQEPFQLRFYPANKLVSIKLISFTGFDSNQKIIPLKQIACNALLAHQNWYIFNRGGFIDFQLPINDAIPATFVIELRDLKIGEQAEGDIKRIGQEIQMKYEKNGGNPQHNVVTQTVNNQQPTFWLNFIKTIAKYPNNFLRNVNLENLKILQKALTNESPALILRNLRNKLVGQEDNGLIPIQEKDSFELEQLISPNNKYGNIVYLCTNLPDYDKSSGGKRATRLLTLLAKTFEVYVLCLGEQSQKYSTALTNRGIQVLREMAVEEIHQQIPSIKTIICAVFGTYIEGQQLAKYYPEAQLIVDTVDVHWVREERSIGIIKELTKEQVAENKQRELAVYQQADKIWTVTAEDKKAILQELPEAVIDIVSNIHEPIIRTYRDNGTNNLLFIGNYKHIPNISAVKKLALEIFPIIRKEILSAQLLIAGADATVEIEQLGNLPGINFLGYIEEEELTNLYEQTFLSISPLLAGAGIKGKICEAIAYQVPVVTNEIGNEGIGLIHEREGLITIVEDMPEIIIKALKRTYDLESITTQAQRKLFKLVGSEIIEKKMLSSIFPMVSICIVTWNKLALLKRCIASILEKTNYPNYKILVHSNGCSDGTQAYLKALGEKNDHIISILSPENEVFVVPNNNMMQLFPSNDVVLLNNDVYVTENWLLALHKTAYLSKEIGITGGKVLYPDGRLQEFGAELYADGRGNNIGKFDDPNQPKYQKLKEVGYVSGCAMYIKRSTINTIGVFDEQFHPCYCEDSDYCYTAKENGIRTVVTPQSIIYHEEGSTSGTDTGTGF